MVTVQVGQGFTVRVVEGIVNPSVFAAMNFEWAANSQYLALI